MTPPFRETERSRIFVNIAKSLNPFRKCFKGDVIILAARRACKRASTTLKKLLVKHFIRSDRSAACEGELLCFDRQIRYFFAQVTGNPFQIKHLKTVHVYIDHPLSGYQHGTP